MNYPSYYSISAADLEKDSKIPMILFENSGEVYFEYALEMLEEVV